MRCVRGVVVKQRARQSTGAAKISTASAVHGARRASGVARSERGRLVRGDEVAREGGSSRPIGMGMRYGGKRALGWSKREQVSRVRARAKEGGAHA